MSEYRYFKEQCEEFIAVHPPRVQWKVYEIYEGLDDEMYLHYLLDCLRDWHPDVLKRRIASNEVRTADMLGKKGDSHLVEPGAEWDMAKELDANNWKGYVDIEWEGQPLHFYRFMFKGQFRDHASLTLIAAKSNAALRSFVKVLEDYGRSRDVKGEPHIIVVNGDDIPMPKVQWEDVILPGRLAEDIRSSVEAFFQSREQYQELGMPHKRGFLLAGPPGCGKTMTLKALANNTKATFIAVLVRAGVDENVIDGAYRLAKAHAPSVVLFEDLDKLVKSEKLSLSYFLNVLDGLKIMEGVLTIATSNEPEKLDPALLHRPSRFDRIWRFSLPDEAQRLSLLQKRGGRYFSQEALEDVAKNTRGFSMAYVQEVVINALLISAHRGDKPQDGHLFASLETLKKQRKSATKPDDSIAERESLGFSSRRQLSSIARRSMRELGLEPDLALLDDE